jgi:predicted amidohydrolase YtcJ
MSSAVAEKADRVYLNGKIITVDDKFSIAEAMASKGDRFIYVGSDAGAKEHIGDKTNVVDLQGRTVTPGLIDSHMHPMYMAERIVQGDIEVRNLDLAAIRKIIASEVGKSELGGWVVAKWYSIYALGIEPHKKHLDDISPNNPVFLRDSSGHAGWVNSKALEVVGITDATPNPKGGHIVRDAEGHATGLLMESAAWDVFEKIPRSFTGEEQDRGDVLASEELFAVGLTGVNDATPTEIGTINRRKALYESGKIRIRMNDMVSVAAAKELGGPQTGLYDNRYALNTVKIVLDGAQSPRSAAMLEDYSDMPGWRGVLRIKPEEYTSDVIEGVKLGYTVHTHAIGDLTIRTTLGAYEKAIAVTGVKDRRLSTAHNHMPHPDDLPRFGKLGIVANGTPLWGCNEAMAMSRFGEERSRLYHAFKSWIDSGAVVVFGTDHPVSPYNPWPNLRAAITREEDGNKSPNPEQRLSREQSLRCYTINCAYMTFEENVRGSIEAGKLADFVVIDRDYMTIPSDEIGDTKVLMTVVGGEVVYEP